MNANEWQKDQTFGARVYRDTKDKEREKEKNKKLDTKFRKLVQPIIKKFKSIAYNRPSKCEKDDFINDIYDAYNKVFNP